MKIRTILLTLILLSAILKAQTGSIRNTLGTGGSFIVKDSANNFLRVEQTTGNVIMLRNLELGADSTSSLTSGNITKNGLPFLSNYGIENTFLGINSGNFTMTGGKNTVVGFGSFRNNSTGVENTALGYNSLNSNTTGNYNTAIGNLTLKNNTTGYANTTCGIGSLFSNTEGRENCAFGNVALYSNTIGIRNSAFGIEALYLNSAGSENSAFGTSALRTNQEGFGNCAFGSYALTFCNGSTNTAIGSYAGYSISTGDNNICIGANANVPDGSLNNQVRIGNTNISYAGIQVAWSITSDRRWKENIQPTNLGLDFISKLNPVRYNRINDENKKIEYGLIAQELEQVLKEEGVTNSAMLTIDGEGRYELRYNDLFAPMIKAIQELKEENGKLKAKVERLNYIELQLAEMQNLTGELVSQINSLKKSEDNKPFQFTKADE